MKTAAVIFIVLVVLLLRPDYLYSFDTVPGRIVMLSAVVYLAQANPVLGLLAAVVTARVLDKAAPISQWRPGPDLLRIETLMRPKDSYKVPALRTTDVPLNDPYNPYTIY
jgi:hypothetical protein